MNKSMPLWLFCLVITPVYLCDFAGAHESAKVLDLGAFNRMIIAGVSQNDQYACVVTQVDAGKHRDPEAKKSSLSRQHHVWLVDLKSSAPPKILAVFEDVLRKQREVLFVAVADSGATCVALLGGEIWASSSATHQMTKIAHIGLKTESLSVFSDLAISTNGDDIFTVEQNEKHPFNLVRREVNGLVRDSTVMISRGRRSLPISEYHEVKQWSVVDGTLFVHDGKSLQEAAQLLDKNELRSVSVAEVLFSVDRRLMVVMRDDGIQVYDSEKFSQVGFASSGTVSLIRGSMSETDDRLDIIGFGQKIVSESGRSKWMYSLSTVYDKNAKRLSPPRQKLLTGVYKVFSGARYCVAELKQGMSRNIVVMPLEELLP